MKESFVVEGLGGKRTLVGEIPVRGSKNAVLPAMASSIIFNAPLRLTNVPDIEDVYRMSELLEHLGAKTEKVKKREYVINGHDIKDSVMDEVLSKKMRASIILSGPLLARFKKVTFPHPGGCVIGARPIDLFLSGFEKMGATVDEKKESFVISAPKGLRGANIFFAIPSVTASETFIMAGVLAKGTTFLKNVALEPEITALAEFLVSCGAKIKGIGTPVLEITGTNGKLLTPKIYKTIPDRLETGSFLILAALAGKDVTITHCHPEHIEALTDLLISSGVSIEIAKSSIRVKHTEKSKLKAFNIKTHEYPGFPTDVQAPTVVYLTQVKGESFVFETIFEGRLQFTQDLVKMGADIKLWDAHRATIQGPTPLKGREVEGPDIRAGLALLVAAIIAKGTSTINSIYYIDRGYERIEERFSALGVDIKRVSGE